MAYTCQIGPGQWLYLENLGIDTVLTVATSSAGQQQQSTSRFALGAWTALPAVYSTTVGVVVRLVTPNGERYLQVQGSQIGVAGDLPTGSLQPLPLQEQGPAPTAAMPPLEPIAPLEPLPPMTPLPPLPPMQMGNMQMSLNPMAMRMGNMAMQMGEPTAPASASQASASAAGPQFCTQCGQPIKPQDRFCGQCGHQVA